MLLDTTHPAPLDRRFSVAPMMAWTTPAQRYFMRLITRHALLYTEMVTSAAIIHGDRGKLLGFNSAEHPVALQLGGSDPAQMAAAAKIGEDFGYDEININVGCPSNRVQNGRFGACLMAEPALVGECVAAMRAAVAVPVTVKTRIGIDHQDEYEALHNFVTCVSQAGCESFTVHARKAWLEGLSPKENREKPPLNYATVHRLKQELPHLQIIVNGGIGDLDSASRHLEQVDGVMLGRAAYRNPYLLSTVDAQFYNDPCPPLSRHEVARALLPYVQQRLQAGDVLHNITRHILGLFHAQPGGKRWRQILSQESHRPGADGETITRALAQIPEHVLQEVA